MKEESKRADEQCKINNPDYKGLIIEMVHKINNKDYLRKIYSFTKVIYSKEYNEKESS